MKNAHLLISLIKNQPTFSKIKEYDEISKFTYSLTSEVHKYISFGYKKEHILYFALKNPNYCKEFNTYIAPNLLSIISSLSEHFPILANVKTIKAYYPQPLQKQQKGKYFTPPKHFASYNEKTQTLYIQTYNEQSKGEFINHCTNPKLHQLFEKIRESIKCNQNNQSKTPR